MIATTRKLHSIILTTTSTLVLLPYNHVTQILSMLILELTIPFATAMRQQSPGAQGHHSYYSRSRISFLLPPPAQEHHTTSSTATFLTSELLLQPMIIVDILGAPFLLPQSFHIS